MIMIPINNKCKINNTNKYNNQDLLLLEILINKSKWRDLHNK